MDLTLAASIYKIYPNIALAGKPPSGGQANPPSTAPPPDNQPVEVSSQISALVKEAQKHYQNAQDKLKAGDWATFGAELKAMEDTLARLVQTATSASNNQQGSGQ